MVSTVATVNPPVGMFLSCFKEDEMIRLGSACWYLEKNLMGMDGEEEEEEIFFFGSTISWRFSLHEQVKLKKTNKQSCGFIHMDRCDSHTQSDHLATATLPGERIVSAFHVNCALRNTHCSFAATGLTGFKRK